jgi:hypothetical protein
VTLYDILDAIADGVNPALGLIAVAQLLNMAYKRRWRCAGIYLATLCALATVIYGFMAFDRRIFDFPYSTHSAFAACFCALHAVYMPRLKFVWLGLLASYLGLILLQGYHSPVDVAVTLALVMPFIAAILMLAKQSEQGQVADNAD